MKNLKIYVASGIFIALTAVKLLSPALASDIRQDVVGVIVRNDDYKQVVETLGKKLSFKDLNEKIPMSAPDSAASELPEDMYMPATIDDLRRDFTSILPESAGKAKADDAGAKAAGQTPDPQATATAQPEATQAPTPTPTPTPVPKATPAVTPTPKVIQTFIDSQKEYSAYAVPADVSYKMPALPFKYEAPVKGYTSSGFGYRVHPILNEVKFHYGTDFAAQSGDSIYAFADGTVETADENDSFGKYIIIDHADGYKTLYAHCSKLYVSAGKTVKRGQKIALVGQTGGATGPHLHFELTSSGTYLNPEFYV